MSPTRRFSTGDRWLESGTHVATGSAWNHVAGPRWESIEFIGTTGSATSFNTSLAMTYPADARIAGVVCYLTATVATSRTINTPSGWVVVDNNLFDDLRTVVFRRVMNGAEAATFNVTRNTGSYPWLGSLYAFRGVDPVVPEQPGLTRTTAQDSSTHTLASLDVERHGGTLFAMVGGYSGGGAIRTFDWQGTERADRNTNNRYLSVMTDGPLPRGASLSRTATTSASIKGSGVMFVMNPAPLP